MSPYFTLTRKTDQLGSIRCKETVRRQCLSQIKNVLISQMKFVFLSSVKRSRVTSWTSSASYVQLMAPQ